MRKNGYTFIELLVVIGIIAILAAVGFPYYQRTKGQFVLERSGINLSQDLRRAQEMAMSSVKFNGSTSDGGYGIYIDVSEPDHYVLFADLNENEECDEPNEAFEDIKLEGGVEISAIGTELFLCSLGWPCTDIIIIFKPPDPEIIIRGKILTLLWLDLSTAGIRITLNGSNKEIFTNSAGLIYVK